MPIFFNPWGTLPESKTLDNALKNAKSAKLTPVEPVDRENKSAVFSGDHGVYHTTLTDCQSEDGTICGGLAQSRRKGLPCKHILRLAMELGLIDCEYQTDARYIRAPKEKPDYDPLAVAIAAIETVPDLIPEVLGVMEAYRLHVKNLVLDIRPFQFLVDNDLLTASRDFTDVEFPLMQKQCIDTLEEIGYTFPDSMKYRKDKYQYVKENASDFLTLLYPDCAVIDIGIHIRECFVPLFTYLSYRSNHEEYRDISSLSPELQTLLRQYDEFYRNRK